jgi:hypothetical protein
MTPDFRAKENSKKIERSVSGLKCLYSSRNATESLYEFWTKEKLIDKLVSCLGSVNSYDINEVTKQIYITHKYYDYAEWFIYRINVYKPTPQFIINRSDLTNRLKKEIASLRSTPTTLNEVITTAVRRIIESVNPEYYHLNGIHGKIRWRLEA